MPAVAPPTSALNPAQQQARDVLGSAGDLPEFPADLGRRLKAQLEAELTPMIDHLRTGGDVTVSKHDLSSVHGCEARMVAEEGAPFTVTVPIARGAVAHKAIELGIHWRGDAHPLELVDEAIARLSETDNWLADWLRTCTDADRAELRSEAGDRVHKFSESFPPLRAGWRPVTESMRIVELLDGHLRLKGKVDVTIGVARGTRAGKVIIDLKSGHRSLEHRNDLRFYALLETICIGVPPRLVASYYLDQGIPDAEPVTVAMLEATLARTVDGAARIAALRSGAAAPVKRPSWSCRWCAIRPGCAEGQAHLRAVDERDGIDSLI